MGKNGGRKGFTLIELSLSVGFISILSLTITLIINDTAATYRRGITLNQVNTTGMDLVDDFRAAIQNAPARQPKDQCYTMYANVSDGVEECVKDNASSLIILRRKGNVDVDHDPSTPAVEVPVYGAICLGSFTYIWNSGYFFGENDGVTPMANQPEGESRETSVDNSIQKATFRYIQTNKDDSGGTTFEDKTIDNFRLLKIRDPQRGVCKVMIQREANGDVDNSGRVAKYVKNTNDNNGGYAGYENSLGNKFYGNINDSTIPNVDRYFPQGIKESDIEVILDDSASNPLALYDFTITPPVTNSAGESAFYSASFILGTVTGGINVAAKGNFCKTPEDYSEDFDYCSINKFNFASQATGG